MSRSRLKLIKARKPPAPPVPPSGKLIAGAGWDGTVSSGWGVSGGEEVPVDPTRTTAKPWAQLLMADYEAISGSSFLISVDAGTSEIAGGVDYVRFYCNGAYLDVFDETYNMATAVDGTSDWRYCYNAPFDCENAIARYPTGSVQVYVEVVPNNPLLQHRVIGPFTFHPRAACANQLDVGSGKAVEKILYCKPSAVSDTAGVRYNSLKKCLDWCVSNYSSTKLVKIICEESGDYKLASVTTETVGANARTHWTIIEALDGVSNVVMGDGLTVINSFGAGMQYDLLTWGKGTKYDWGKASPNGVGQSLRNNTTRSMRWQCCELTCGGFPASFGGTDTGINSLLNGLTVPGYFVASQSGTAFMNVYFENCYIHDMPDYCFLTSRLVRGCTVDMIGGSCFESIWGAAHNVTASRVGGPWTTLLTPEDAIQLTYTGSDTVEFEVTNPVGFPTRTFRVYINGELSSLALSKTGPTTNADVKTWFEGLGAGFSCTIIGNRLAAIFLSETVPLNSNPIARQTLTSGVPKVLTDWVDIHANGIVFHTAPRENVAIRFITMNNLRGASAISFNANMNVYSTSTGVQVLATPGVRDIGIRNCIINDTGPSDGHSGGYMGPTFDHLFFAYNTAINALTNFTDTMQPTEYTQFKNVYHMALAYSPRTPKAATPTSPQIFPVPDMNINGLAVLASVQLSLPQNSDANSKRATGAEADLFVDLSDPTSADATPTAELTLNDGSWAGALTSAGNWQAVSA